MRNNDDNGCGLTIFEMLNRYVPSDKEMEFVMWGFEKYGRGNKPGDGVEYRRMFRVGDTSAIFQARLRRLGLGPHDLITVAYCGRLGTLSFISIPLAVVQSVQADSPQAVALLGNLGIWGAERVLRKVL